MIETVVEFVRQAGPAVVLAVLLGLGLSAAVAGCDREDAAVVATESAEWEVLSDSSVTTFGSHRLERLRVEGGWIVRDRYNDAGQRGGVALCFQPDVSAVRS